MFSYTDDAIVTSSPTGRHLSTVIRRHAAIGPLDWSEHADQVCKVLNELDRNAKLNYRVCYSLGAGHFQTVGRVYRTGGGAYLGPFPVAPAGEQGAKLDWAIHYPVGMADMRQGPKAADSIEPVPGARFLNDETFDATSDLGDFGPIAFATPGERIAELEKQLDDATTKLAAAQMLLEKPVRLTADDVLRVLSLQTDTAIDVDGRTLARVE